MEQLTRQPMYITIADELCALLHNGQIKDGERLPSVRHLVHQKGISATTAIAALRAVEQRGFAFVKPQSGYFVKNRARAFAAPSASRPSAAAHAIGVDSIMIQVLDASRDPAIAPLGAAAPDPALFPLKRLNRALLERVRRQPRGLAEYALNYAGADELREQLLRRYAELGCAIAPQELLITNGCTEALHIALRTVSRSGDTVAIESPSYYGILQVLQDLGLNALEIATHPSTGLQVESLEQMLGSSRRRITACLMTSNFSNPTGACMSNQDKRRLVELCVRHDIALIEDDIYGDLQHSGTRPLPAKSFDVAGGVILCSSFSKTLAPGARIGWACGGKYSKAMRLRKFASSGASAPLLQEVAADLLRTGGYERHLSTLRAAYAVSVNRMASAVAEHFPSGTRITQPRGGFVIWVELPAGIDCTQLLPAALKRGVNFAPGSLFSPSGGFKNFLRLNCGYRWSPALDSAVTRLGVLAKSVLRQSPIQVTVSVALSSARSNSSSNR